jgi:Ca-activated chloride channel family protein
VGERLINDISATPASGSTALYDAVLKALDLVEGRRQESGETYRYGVVVLSDGRDTDSRGSLSLLEARLKPSEADPRGIQIHTIAIGKDADERVLKKIASLAHGKYWKGNTQGDMVQIYQDIAAHY